MNSIRINVGKTEVENYNYIFQCRVDGELQLHEFEFKPGTDMKIIAETVDQYCAAL